MEAVRNSLFSQLGEISYAVESEDSDVGFSGRSQLGSDSGGLDKADVDWNPSVLYKRFPVFCSQQLNAA